MIQTITLKRPDKNYYATLYFCKLPLATLLKQKDSFLHPKENNYFQNLKHEKRQLSFLIGRYSAKQAINHLLDAPVADNEINIEQAVFKNPVIQCNKIHNINVSISHSDYWGVAIAYPEAHPLAIDIELINKKKTKAIQSQVTEQEVQLIDNIKSLDETEKYTMMWTIKESLSKALKTGLMTPFTLYEVKFIEENDGVYTSEFTSFAQYKTLSFKHDNIFCSVILPKKTEWCFANN